MRIFENKKKKKKKKKKEKKANIPDIYYESPLKHSFHVTTNYLQQNWSSVCVRTETCIFQFTKE